MTQIPTPVDPNFDSDQQHWADTFTALSNVSTVPWVLLSAGVNYETFETQTRLACKAGASG
jgi:tagatose 1,6-diphosphate aldolase